VQATVTDNGRGGADPSGSGLQGLSDRLAPIGGRLLVASDPATGTTVTATIRSLASDDRRVARVEGRHSERDKDE
jgi:signal transduction histidine kinase